MPATAVFQDTSACSCAGAFLPLLAMHIHQGLTRGFPGGTSGRGLMTKRV